MEKRISQTKQLALSLPFDVAGADLGRIGVALDDLDLHAGADVRSEGTTSLTRLVSLR
jgi:hypothetical protein